MSRLVQNRVMAHKDLRTLTKYQLILARDQFRKNPPAHIKGPQQGMLEGDFALCISLYHGYELLMQMGLRSLFFYIQGIMDGSREMSRARNELQRTPTFMDLYHEMESMFVKPSAGPDESFIYSHPKLEKLEEVVVKHFRLWAESSAVNNGRQEVNTRVMIFSSFRESVQEIAAMLNRHAPLIRVMTFMGQASSGKGVKGFTQKEQLEVVQRFRQGGFNTLVSTCVGEEGLDIGEVDLIVCFDAQKNPTRLVQRMGRTGRKRHGRIVVILAAGREERTYNQSQSNKRSVYKSITGNKSGFHMYPNNPRMLPEGVNPTLHKMHITCGQFDHRESSRRSVRGRQAHSEGRAALIHPQSLIRQGSATLDGFLSSTEYSVWAATMKLKGDEPYPFLRQSSIMSLPSDLPPQEDVSTKGHPSRELSLWEWRHWQHKAFPTHVVDHSLRCQHFIKVMELIDSMREEDEGECRYEQELLPYLQNADGGGHGKNTQKSKKGKNTCTKTTNSKAKQSHFPMPDLESLVTEIDEEDVELQAMFYLPKWDSAPALPAKAPQRRDESLKVILANVAELLSRSPPSLTDDLEVGITASVPQSPHRPHQPFPVSFTLDVDEDEDDDDDAGMLNDAGYASTRADTSEPPVDQEHSNKMSHDWPCQEPQSVSISADSPSWDEVFENEEVDDIDDIRDHRKEDCAFEQVEDNEEIKMKYYGRSEVKDSWDDVRKEEMPELTAGGVKDNGACQGSSHLDESMDLFGDDEVFLQMTIPDISTPGRTSACAGDISNSTKVTSSISQMHNSQNVCSTKHSPDSTDKLRTVQKDGVACTHDLTHTSHVKQTPHDANVHKTNHTAAQSKPIADRSATEDAITSYCKSPAAPQNDSSRDYFPVTVNFDLGYSLEDSEDEAETGAVMGPSMLTSPQTVKQVNTAVPMLAITNSSTPYNSVSRQRIPLQCTGSKQSTPQMLAEQRKRGSSSLLTSPLMSKGGRLPSPITSPGARRMLMPDTGSSRTPSLPFSLKRRRMKSHTTEVEGTSGAENKGLHQEYICTSDSPPHAVECNSDSEDEVVVVKRRPQNKVKPLSSPEVSRISTDVDSPLVVNRKRAAALNTSDEMEGEAVSDDDFQNDSVFPRRTTAQGGGRQRVQQGKAKRTVCPKGRQFLDEEAELSEDEEGGDMSSDEEDGEEQNKSLEGFVVDNTHFSQGLNDSEMHGIYLKSVRSPAVQGKFKMSHRSHHNMDIFSQVPEMDETYAEDSFVVGSEVEEVESSEEEVEDIELMPEDSYVDGRRQYATRRRVFLHKARAESKAPSEQKAGLKAKRTRVIRINDSSEEETEHVGKDLGLVTRGAVTVPLQPKVVQPEPSRLQEQHKPLSSLSSKIASKVSALSKAQRSSGNEEQQKERCRQRLENQHLLSDELDFVEPLSTKNQPQAQPATSSGLQPQTSIKQDLSVTESPAPHGSACILVDSRCISSSVELMTSLRQRHAATVHVCSLDGSYFIVSNRMAVERHSQSDLAATQNRKRLAERVNSLQRLFERICLIVEKDRTKPGETSRPFQRTRYYDSTLAGLVRTGVRLLWSHGSEESAGLLVDLAQLEQRKGQGIAVPLEVKGQHKQQALQMYLSLPAVNYAHALNLSHNFGSIAQLINSPIEAIQKRGCMSHSRAEEIYRLLHYSCDSFFLNSSKAGKNS
ncbi:hypothetical protein Q5P01_020177 [Channa striata]|uniref:Helicase C-terminal domain-containing protein n=1 Tax=Channa striata TaxID=64152 RepID=A0AA88LX71_CHASR|nr:hypothetical protein Q5P01_020177 [Channa striata]